jgi:hypothetical protein
MTEDVLDPNGEVPVFLRKSGVGNDEVKPVTDSFIPLR